MPTKIRFVKVLVNRDAMTKIPKVIYPWDLEVLRIQFGDDRIQVTGDEEITIEDALDPAQEFARMEAMYGMDDETKASCASVVYGRGNAGVAGVAGAMRDAMKGKRKAERVEPVAPIVPDDSELEDAVKADDSDPLKAK